MIKKIILISGMAVFLCCAFFLPGQILLWESGREIDNVTTVPKESYQSEDSALAKEASARLSNEEKLRLITGEWESEISEAGDFEMQLQGYEAVRMAREKMQALYKKGEFPVDLSELYQNWYGWQVTPYKAVDATFHTYTAYYWEIVFERFDRQKNYTVWMLEDGTIFEL